MIDPPGQGDGRAAQADASAANRASAREGDLPKPLAQASNVQGDQPCSPGAGPFAAIDPGRSKCGLVISNDQASAILYAAVLPPQRALAQLRQWQEQHLSLIHI